MSEISIKQQIDTVYWALRNGFEPEYGYCCCQRESDNGLYISFSLTHPNPNFFPDIEKRRANSPIGLIKRAIKRIIQ